MSTALRMQPKFVRRLPVGAEVTPNGAVHFRVWAPKRRQVDVVLEDGRGAARAVIPLRRERGGYFAGEAGDEGDGIRYRYRLDGGESFADPASRFQPEGVHGPSQVVDPSRYRWTDAAWHGVPREHQVAYEMHVGTFTPGGIWAAAIPHLADLAELGITVIEVMPVAEFPGRFGWGYDGVLLFAPTRLYGTPDDMRRFVDAAHAAGLGVILDVVYNHLGPSGNRLTEFSDTYFSTGEITEWGDAMNFDGPGSGPVRELCLANAGYWIDEFHLDGLRLDATQSVFDRSERHILRQIGDRVRSAAGSRRTWIVNESEPQHARLVRPPSEGGYGLDAMWNDDFHHAARVAATGRTEAYFHDYHGSPQELVSAAKHGFLYQGQRYAWQNQRRGHPARDLAPCQLVHFLQNHDQIANSARGERLHQLVGPARLRALTALLLLGPQTPMLFQGQEFGASAPFLYFADHEPDLAEQVRQGRREFLRQFPSLGQPDVADRLAAPEDAGTFDRCKLDWSERDAHSELVALHADLLRLRRNDLSLEACRPGEIDGAVIGPAAFVVRRFAAGGADRLLAVNLGVSLDLAAIPEPLTAPPEGRRWRVRWYSESPRCGGGGAPPLEDDDGRWYVPADSATLLVAEPDDRAG